MILPRFRPDENMWWLRREAPPGRDPRRVTGVVLVSPFPLRPPVLVHARSCVPMGLRDSLGASLSDTTGQALQGVLVRGGEST